MCAGARLAARLDVSTIVIGFTIVSVGTGTPELAVGGEAALRGTISRSAICLAASSTTSWLSLGLTCLVPSTGLAASLISSGSTFQQ